MLPSPTADPIAERMNTFRDPNASRGGACVVAVTMTATLPETIGGRPPGTADADAAVGRDAARGCRCRATDHGRLETP